MIQVFEREQEIRVHGIRPTCVVLVAAACAIGGGCATKSSTGVSAHVLAPDQPQFVRHGPTAEHPRKAITDAWYSDNRLSRFEIGFAASRVPASATYQASLGSQSAREVDHTGAEGDREESGQVSAETPEGVIRGTDAARKMIEHTCDRTLGTAKSVGEGAFAAVICGTSILLAPIVIAGGGLLGPEHSASEPAQPATYDGLERSSRLAAEGGIRVLNSALRGQNPARSIAEKIHAVINTRTTKYARMDSLDDASDGSEQDEWADARLWISLDRIDLVTLEEEIAETRPLRFRLFVQVEVSFEALGERVAQRHREVIGYLSPASELDDIEANDGRLLRHEIDQAFLVLAEFIALGQYQYQPPPREPVRLCKQRQLC